MLLLALDTATPAVTVAVHDGSDVLAERSAVDARRHAELLAPLVAEVLGASGAEPRDLTDVVAGTGPGPFTGLRVGLVTARTLGLALGARVHGVCTLDVLAAQARADRDVPADQPFVVATDARRREVYWAAYSGGVRVDGPHVSRAADLPLAGRPVVGRGAELYPAELGAPRGPLDPSAGVLARLAVALLAAGADLSDLEPRYLRRPDVHETGRRKSVLT